METYFQTKKLLCQSNRISNFFKNMMNLPSSFINVNTKYDNEILKKLQSYYEQFLNDKNPVTFISSVLNLKYGMQSKNQNIKNKNPFYKNPRINVNQLFILKNKFIKSIDVKKQLNLVVYGKYIRTDFPSIGIIHNLSSELNVSFQNRLKTTKYSDQITFFQEIKNIFTNNEHFYLPLQNLELGKTISSLLLKGENRKLFIDDYVNTLDVHFQRIQKINKKKILNSKYMIPYIIQDNEIKKMKDSQISQYMRNPTAYFELYEKLCTYVFTFLDQTNRKESLKNTQKLAYLLLFQHIQIYYDIYYQFIDHITKYIISMKQSDHVNYQNLDYESCFSYLKKLNDSLLSQKTILLNNAFQLFKPNKSSGIYGIQYKNNIFDIDDQVIFLGSNVHVNYPLGQTQDKEKLISFFTEFDENSIYGGSKLFIGVQYLQNEYLSTTLTILNQNNKSSNKYFEYNMRIIDKLLNVFENCIPIELLAFLENKQFINNLNKNDFITEITNEYQFYLEKSTHYILLQMRKNVNNMSKKKYYYISKIYYHISYFIKKILERVINDQKLKEKLITEFQVINNKCLSKIPKN